MRSVGVIGGGTAGWLTALALKKRFPDLAVTLVESPDIPIIGVGEATTTLMPPFLHQELGLDIVSLFERVKPTFKLGIKFEWGERDFCYPFGDTDPLRAAACDGNLDQQSLTGMLMLANRIAPQLLPRQKFAYHLDNAPFVAFLAENAAGIAHERMTIDQVMVSHGQIDCLRGARELRFDLYVDATGFRSLLLEEALHSSFIDYSSSLFCDRAIVAAVPSTMQPYTTAETMNAGWCWRIPVHHEDHRGYVHSSRFLDEESAIAEMRAKNPGMGEPSIVRFRSGRHRDFWLQNVVAVGNSYGFVEPLESTALHMVIVELAYLVAVLAGEIDLAFANESLALHWDFLRWFLAIHYKFNRRLDTPFWKTARAETNSSGLDEAIARFREGVIDSGFQVGDPAFGYSGVQLLLLGQRVFAPARREDPNWRARVLGDRELVNAAPSQALARIDPRSLLSPNSWILGQAERALVARKTPLHPRAG